MAYIGFISRNMKRISHFIEEISDMKMCLLMDECVGEWIDEERNRMAPEMEERLNEIKRTLNIKD